MTHRKIHIERSVRTAVLEPSKRVIEIACMFGLGIGGDDNKARGELVIVPPVDLTLVGGQIVFVTGASGSGKSTILRLIAEAVPECCTLQLSGTCEALIDNADRPIIDLIAIDQSIESAVRYLSLAGLADAFVMLRTVSELSDGQRYRFALARMMEQAEKRASSPGLMTIVLTDEFCATLDRFTAKAIAKHVRKWVASSPQANVCFVCATTHDDLLEALEPDVLIEKHLDGTVEVLKRDDVKAAHSK